MPDVDCSPETFRRVVPESFPKVNEAQKFILQQNKETVHSLKVKHYTVEDTISSQGSIAIQTVDRLQSSYESGYIIYTHH